MNVNWVAGMKRQVRSRSRLFAYVHGLTRPAPRSGPRYPALGGGRLLQETHLPLEVGEVLEALVDGGETQIGDRVEGAQVVENGAADHLAADLGALLPDLVLHRRRQGGDVLLADRTVLGRPADAVGDLGPVERFPVPRALHHHHLRLLHALEGGVAAATAQALPAPASGGTAVGHAGIDNLVVHPMAERAAHGRHRTPPLPSGRPQTYVCSERPFVLPFPWPTDRGGASMKDLTPRQRQILEFVDEEVRRRGYPPSV